MEKGRNIRIEAADHVHYRLADESGLAPDGVQTGRAGNDLIVYIDGEALAHIDNYFLLDDSNFSNPLLGMNESGQYIAYPVSDSAVLPLDHQLAGEITSIQTGAANLPPAAVLGGIAGLALIGGSIAVSGNIHRDGDDVYSVADYTLQTDETNLMLLGSADNLTGTGNAGNNTLIGNMLKNTLNGGDGNDTLDGGYGADTLTGGKGADTFVFQSRIDGKNIDTIIDFNRAEGDKIALSDVLIGKLEGDWFAKDGESHTDATRIYQQGDTLYYDADGQGGLAGAAFANIGQAKLDDQDFTLLNKLLIL